MAGRISPVAILAYPFLVGGVAYALWNVARGRGRAFLALFASAPQWARAAMFFGTQVTVVVVTLGAGAVDAALLSLVGDVALTPIFVVVFLGEGRPLLRSPVFLGGVALSTGGATLTIVAEGALVGLSGYALIAAPFEALLIAGFFTSAAYAGRSQPIGPIAGQAALLAGLFSVAVAAAWPGGLGNLAVPVVPPFALLAGAGVTSFFIAPALYFDAIGRAGIVLPALLMAAIPVFTLFIAALFDRQVPPLEGILGVPVAVAGALLAVESQARLAPSAE